MEYKPIDAVLDLKNLIKNIHEKVNRNKIQGIVMMSCKDEYNEGYTGMTSIIGDHFRASQLLYEAMLKDSLLRVCVLTALIECEKETSSLEDLIEKIKFEMKK